MYREFEEYVWQFNYKDKAISHKFFHSKRVAIINALIAMNLKLSYHEVLLARQIGLLHDIGRFQEWDKFKSYKGEQFDHAAYGVEILRTKNYYLNYNMSKDDKEILLKAIYYHNKYSVSKNYKNKYQVKMIRDADKIDILYYLGIGQDFNTYIDSQVINKKVLNCFNYKRLVHNPDIKTCADRVVANLAFIFDINFNYSLYLIKEKKYLENYYNNIKEKESYKKYFEYVNKYIEKRLKNVRY